MRAVLLANAYVGKEITTYLLDNFPDDILKIVLIDGDNEFYNYLVNEKKICHNNIIWSHEIYSEQTIKMFEKARLDYIFSCWWPLIIKDPLLSMPSSGIVNLHPSYLPYNRGKDPNFWAIVENTPFGISIHYIDKGVDTGKVIFQKEIPYKWTDTGESLYVKGVEEIISLFKEKYTFLRNNYYTGEKQDSKYASFHKRKELDQKSKIELDKLYLARDLLNLLRARTFPPHPGCFFIEDDEKYEVRIMINKVE